MKLGRQHCSASSSVIAQAPESCSTEHFHWGPCMQGQHQALAKKRQQNTKENEKKAVKTYKLKKPASNQNTLISILPSDGTDCRISKRKGTSWFLSHMQLCSVGFKSMCEFTRRISGILWKWLSLGSPKQSRQNWAHSKATFSANCGLSFALKVRMVSITLFQQDSFASMGLGAAALGAHA